MDDLIDFGQGANTGTGDTIREAFEKVERRLAALLGEQPTLLTTTGASTLLPEQVAGAVSAFDELDQRLIALGA